MKYFAFADSQANSSAPSEILLLKVGDNTFTIGGKVGKFTVTDEDMDNCISEFNSRGKDMVMDYDHATLDKTASSQGNAPASGWINQLVKTPAGLVGKVKSWTAKAKSLIDKGEYKYDSPVVMFSPDNKRINSIHSVAITNHPAIHGTASVSSFNDFDMFFDTERSDMIIEDHKRVVNAIKKNIDELQYSFSDNLGRLADAGKEFPHRKPEIQEFINNLFVPEMKALNDMGKDIRMIKFSDESDSIDMMIQTWRETLNGADMLEAIDKELTQTTDDDAITKLRLEKQRMLEFQMTNQEEWDKGIVMHVDEQPEITVEQASIPAVTVVPSPNSVMGTAPITGQPSEVMILPANDTSLPLCDTLDNVVALLTKILEGKSEPDSVDVVGQLKQRLAGIPQMKMMFIHKDDDMMQTPDQVPTPTTVESTAATIQRSLLPLSDLGIKETDGNDAIVLALNDAVKFKKEVTKVCTRLKVMKFSDIASKIEKMDEETNTLKAQQVVDRMIDDGKITIGMRKWAIDYAKKDMKAFNDHMVNSPIIFNDPNAKKADLDKPVKQFSDLERKICAEFGNDPSEVVGKFN